MGGPFDWRTMNLPDSHKSDLLVIPLPAVSNLHMESYATYETLRTAEYRRQASLNDRRTGLLGVIFEYQGTRQ